MNTTDNSRMQPQVLRYHEVLQEYGGIEMRMTNSQHAPINPYQAPIRPEDYNNDQPATISLGSVDLRLRTIIGGVPVFSLCSPVPKIHLLPPQEGFSYKKEKKQQQEKELGEDEFIPVEPDLGEEVEDEEPGEEDLGAPNEKFPVREEEPGLPEPPPVFKKSK
ncbi:hypothetical protein VNO77_14557 [Canavalia gladiata]|uniref:Uncharacterized protein n=1 Tax=Canavalia gladiata TaxID=3824 RepID=A0AAN9LYY6_CANGL